MNPPSRSEIIEKLRLLIQGTVTREFVAAWAQKWAIADNPPDMDKSLWQAVTFLAMVDGISTDRPYLFVREDFERELAKLLA